MKKFNTTELLSRAEMKKVAGSGYGGCAQGSCGFTMVGSAVVGVSCETDFAGTCRCVSGPLRGSVCSV